MLNEGKKACVFGNGLRKVPTIGHAFMTTGIERFLCVVSYEYTIHTAEQREGGISACIYIEKKPLGKVVVTVSAEFTYLIN